MQALSSKKILIGITGGIAAYKSAELVRRVREAGADVRVVMTKAATEFITPLTMQALSGNPVHTRLLDRDEENAMGHIRLARWADAILIAPATANCIAKLANGLADDLLSTVCLCANVPLAIAPAMNQAMWSNPASQNNIAQLKQRGVHLFGPGIGSQACGEVGLGRMLEPDQLLEQLQSLFMPGTLAGLNVLVTAGPTREALDPVRYIGNRSSGKMGYAIAGAAREAGASVTLISGPVSLPEPAGVRRILVENAAEMYQASMTSVSGIDIFIGAAAVSDYRPVSVAKQKIKKQENTFSFEWETTEDIIASVAAIEQPPFMVGFCAETERLEENARIKLAQKSLDMIVANQVGMAGTGFESDDNALHVIWQGGDQIFTRDSKHRLARQLMELVAGRYRLSRKLERVE